MLKKQLSPNDRVWSKGADGLQVTATHLQQQLQDLGLVGPNSTAGSHQGNDHPWMALG